MALNDAKLKAATPRKKPYKLADKDGLYVIVSPAGGVAWKWNFQLNGRQKTLSLGRWPAISIKEARRRLMAAKAQLSDGTDPAAAKQERKQASKPNTAATFEIIARDWHKAQSPRWTDAYAAQVLVRLEADVFEHIGKKRFAEITRSDVLETLRRVEARGVFETTRRLRQYIGQIYRFAGAEDESIIDPTPMLKGALTPPPKQKHHKRLAFDQMGDFLRKLGTYEAELQGEPETRLAIKLTILTVARTLESTAAAWTEFEHWRTDRVAANALWRVPAERMKMDDPHIVPLSTQAVELLRELHELTGKRTLLFPQPFGRERPMSNNAMLGALYRMGYRGRATMHGMRAVFSTWANENRTRRGNLWTEEDVELCLAHDERNAVRGAYNAAKRLHERRVLLQAWADAIDEAEALALV